MFKTGVKWERTATRSAITKLFERIVVDKSLECKDTLDNSVRIQWITV